MLINNFYVDTGVARIKNRNFITYSKELNLLSENTIRK